jgi:hypothetical protein
MEEEALFMVAQNGNREDRDAITLRMPNQSKKKESGA